MELNQLITIMSSVLVAGMLLIYIWNWLWLKPKKMEKFLKDQGLKGTPYRFMHGDLKEMVHMKKEVESKPMSLTHDICHRVSPFVNKSLTNLGKNYFTWIGTKPVVHIYEPSMIQEILSNHIKFRKPMAGNSISKLLLGGLLHTEGDQWVKHRKIVNPAFHVEKLKHMLPALYVSCSEMMEKWLELLTKEGSSSSCEVDVSPYLHTFTGDVISRTAFSSSFEEGRNIFELQREQLELVIKVSQSLYIPGSGSGFLPTKNTKRIKEIKEEVKNSIKSIINKRVAAMEAGEASNDDLLGVLLDSNYKEIKQHGNNNYGLTIDQVIEECKLFYFAGQETTANMLVWTMILLGKHTKWQELAREEVLRIFAHKKPNIDGFNRLKVINMIFNEVLRLYSPSTFLRREIYEETKLGKLTIPAGSLLQINSLIMHHDKDIWGEDAKEFNPGRFSEGVSKVTKGQVVYTPFGGGPRICIGQNFAMLEGKVALAMILQRFSFELSPSYSHGPYTLLTLQPQFGAHLILHKL